MHNWNELIFWLERKVAYGTSCSSKGFHLFLNVYFYRNLFLFSTLAAPKDRCVCSTFGRESSCSNSKVLNLGETLKRKHERRLRNLTRGHAAGQCAHGPLTWAEPPNCHVRLIGPEPDPASQACAVSWLSRTAQGKDCYSRLSFQNAPTVLHYPTVPGNATHGGRTPYGGAHSACGDPSPACLPLLWVTTIKLHRLPKKTKRMTGGPWKVNRSRWAMQMTSQRGSSPVPGGRPGLSRFLLSRLRTR